MKKNALTVAVMCATFLSPIVSSAAMADTIPTPIANPGQVVVDGMQDQCDALAAAHDTGATVTTLTLADAFVGDDMLALRDGVMAVNDLVRTLAAQYDAVLLDLWQHPLRLRPELLSADRIHFTMTGHAVLATEMVRALHARMSQSVNPLR